VQALTADARALAELIAVSEQPGLAGAAGAAVPELDRARLFAALQQLVTSRLLLSAADHYAFYQRGVAQVLRDAMSAQRWREVHACWPTC